MDGIGGNAAKEHSFFSIEGLELALSCFKPTFEENEYIIRVYEIEGKNGQARLKFDRDILSAKLIDLCENDIGDLSFDNKSVVIPVEAHSILTVKIKLNE